MKAPLQHPAALLFKVLDFEAISGGLCPHFYTLTSAPFSRSFWRTKSAGYWIEVQDYAQQLRPAATPSTAWLPRRKRQKSNDLKAPACAVQGFGQGGA